MCIHTSHHFTFDPLIIQFMVKRHVEKKFDVTFRVNLVEINVQ